MDTIHRISWERKSEISYCPLLWSENKLQNELRWKLSPVIPVILLFSTERVITFPLNFTLAGFKSSIQFSPLTVTFHHRNGQHRRIHQNKTLFMALISLPSQEMAHQMNRHQRQTLSTWWDQCVCWSLHQYIWPPLLIRKYMSWYVIREPVLQPVFWGVNWCGGHGR